jgi:hypothetical protein
VSAFRGCPDIRISSSELRNIPEPKTPPEQPQTGRFVLRVAIAPPPTLKFFDLSGDRDARYPPALIISTAAECIIIKPGVGFRFAPRL